MLTNVNRSLVKKHRSIGNFSSSSSPLFCYFKNFPNQISLSYIDVERCAGTKSICYFFSSAQVRSRDSWTTYFFSADFFSSI